ncbi:ABC transporter permease [Rufibacter sediminis]|uniref:ABC transporter permease n=1 Tax=Rufibacter sediminis TaxID=2762756 RepID=A0ABR6VRW3_9BACT|nr:ABC transporter permease [Rufibacter sediminis]MBC3539891.1 ABC transporter permease [Rufibacter sediminis]
MTSLLRIELRKLLPYSTFWVLLLLQCCLLFIFFYARGNVMVNGQMAGAELYQFPKLWMHLAYISSFLNLIPGILIIILVSDEYAFRTLRQQVIDGFSRANLVQSKYSIILLLALLLAAYVLFLGLGFGLYHGQNTDTSSIFTDSQYIFYYLVQLVGYMSLAMLVAFLVRKTGLAIMVFMAYTLVVERLIQWQTPDALDKYFPMKTLGALTPNPHAEIEQLMLGVTDTLSPVQALAPAVLYVTLFCFLSYQLLRSRDL